jgi:hypothetical protein
VIDGKIEILADPADRPLIVKPTHGEGGDGLRMLGPISDRPGLAARLRGTRQDCLVQPLVTVHPALADIALGALPTVRIVTMLDENGAPELVSATFRCASDPRARVDNMKAGGLIVPVALEDGRLGRACFGYGGRTMTSTPPRARRSWAGPLPGWDSATALAIGAHQDAFADYILIGWDVALTARGPAADRGQWQARRADAAARGAAGARRHPLRPALRTSSRLIIRQQKRRGIVTPAR